MNWLKYELHTNTHDAPIIGNILCSMGIDGYEITDHVPLTEKEACAHFYLIVNAEASNQASALFDWVESHSKDK